jgi:hypothetical protein
MMALTSLCRDTGVCGVWRPHIRITVTNILQLDGKMAIVDSGDSQAQRGLKDWKHVGNNRYCYGYQQMES